MADVIVKGMEMPKACGCCCFCTMGPMGDECAINCAIVTEYQKCPKDCPLRPAPEWISMEERLPEEKHAVLVWQPQYRNHYVVALSDGEWYVFGGYGMKVFGVTHWMPLPEVPEEDHHVL